MRKLITILTLLVCLGVKAQTYTGVIQVPTIDSMEKYTGTYINLVVRDLDSGGLFHYEKDTSLSADFVKIFPRISGGYWVKVAGGTGAIAGWQSTLDVNPLLDKLNLSELPNWNTGLHFFLGDTLSYIGPVYEFKLNPQFTYIYEQHDFNNFTDFYFDTTRAIMDAFGDTTNSNIVITRDSMLFQFNSNDLLEPIQNIKLTNKNILIDGARIGHSGENNLYFGLSTLKDNLGSFNTAIGDKAMRFATANNNSVAVGQSTLSEVNGSFNTGVGVRALQFTQRDSSTAIGYVAGQNTWGIGNTLLGTHADAAQQLLADSVASSNIVQGDTVLTGADITSFISTASLSIGDTMIFYLTLPTAPTGQQSPINAMGVITDANTISLLNQIDFKSGSYGTNFWLAVYDKQAYSVAIGLDASTLSSNQLGISPYVSSLYIPGMSAGRGSVLRDTSGTGIYIAVTNVIVFTPANSTDATYPDGTLAADDTYLYFRKSNGTWVKESWNPF